MIPYREAVHPEKSVPDSLPEKAAMRRVWPPFFYAGAVGIRIHSC